jgi:hypothetical protein
MNRTQRLLAGLAEQMYRDVRFVAHTNPTVVVDEETSRMFNNLLAEVRRTFPHAVETCGFEEMSARTLKYKDALVIVGQLMCLVRVLSGPEPVAAPAPLAPVAPPPPFTPREVAPAVAAPPPRLATPPPGVPERRRELTPEPEVVPDPPEPSEPHDRELLGPIAPVHMNADGTVRFSLDD